MTAGRLCSDIADMRAERHTTSNVLAMLRQDPDNAPWLRSSVASNFSTLRLLGPSGTRHNNAGGPESHPEESCVPGGSVAAMSTPRYTGAKQPFPPSPPSTQPRRKTVSTYYTGAGQPSSPSSPSLHRANTATPYHTGPGETPSPSSQSQHQINVPPPNFTGAEQAFVPPPEPSRQTRLSRWREALERSLSFEDDAAWHALARCPACAAESPASAYTGTAVSATCAACRAVFDPARAADAASRRHLLRFLSGSAHRCPRCWRESPFGRYGMYTSGRRVDGWARCPRCGFGWEPELDESFTARQLLGVLEALPRTIDPHAHRS